MFLVEGQTLLVLLWMVDRLVSLSTWDLYCDLELQTCSDAFKCPATFIRRSRRECICIFRISQTK